MPTSGPLRGGLHHVILAVLSLGALVTAQLALAGGAVAGVSATKAAARPASAPQPQVVWELPSRTMDPAKGTDLVTHTFVRTTTCYQVGVVLESSNPSDALYIQLGTNGHDYGEVTSGSSISAAWTLQVGVMPALL